MTRVNKDEHEAPENLHNESSDKRERAHSGSTMKRNSWMEIESLRKGREGGEKQRQLGLDEMNSGIK